MIFDAGASRHLWGTGDISVINHPNRNKSAAETVIDISIAKKVLEVVDAGLSSGVGNPIPGQMCVEAAVCYALGLPHGDDPACVSRALYFPRT